MRWRARNLFAFLDRLWFWLPVLWKDRDWDSAHLYYMMAKKIERLRASTVGAGRHVGWEECARDMSVAIELLTRMSEYSLTESCPYPLTCPEHEDLRPCCWFEKECPECDKTAKRRFKWQRMKEAADEAYLWDLMHKQSGRWWD